jgi:4-hydroxy-3-polyprenylbenzoate decarboxylase
MAFKNIDQFISLLESQGELVRITEFCDPKLVIAEITDRMSKQKDGGKALLFENTGTGIPLLINAMGSLRRMCLALGTDDLENIRNEITGLLKSITGPKPTVWDKLKMLPELGRIASYMPKIKSGRGECQQLVNLEPDLSKLPILKCWPADGGPFITLPMVITKDPLTGIRNVGMYRMQVYSANTTGMHWHKHKVGARHFAEYKKLGKKMPVSVAIGGDPAHTFAATAPLPDNMDEFMLSGFLRKKKVELVKCITNDLEVPADADFIIEGYVDTSAELVVEGPFGDHTGFYSLPDLYPVFHVTCVTSRQKPVYPATIVGVPPMEDAYIAKATERIFLAPIQMALAPEVADMDMPVAGVAHNLTIASIEKTFPGQGLKIMNSLWGAGQMMFNKILIATDSTVNLHDYRAVALAAAKNAVPSADYVTARGPLDVLDHSAPKLAYGGKLFIDATTKFDEEITNAAMPLPMADDFSSKAIKALGAVSLSCAEELRGLPVLIAAVSKTGASVLDTAAAAASDSGIADCLRVLLLMDSSVPVDNLGLSLWVAMNNIDPHRDSKLIDTKYGGCMVLDATAKNPEADGFARDWPNIVSSAQETIETVDNLWNKLGLGDFVPSPSARYSGMITSEGAFARKVQ